MHIVKKTKVALNNFGKQISDENLIKFDHKVLLLIAISLILFSSSVFLKIHQSSIQQWDNYLPQTNNEKEGLLLGYSKNTRSDEWGVQTPFILAQVKHNPRFPVKNESLGGGQVPLLMSLPVYHLSSFFKPQNWGFFVFNLEYGYSFFWNFKFFGLFFGLFFLLMIFTNNFWLSVFGSLWFLFSSFTQWWFSTSLPEIVMSFCFIVTSFIYVIFSFKKALVFLASIILTVFSINFALLFYPPFQIPLVYLGVFLILGYLFKNINLKRIKQNVIFKVASFTGVLIVFTASAYFFYTDAREAINLIKDTAYPGSRFVTGGGIDITRLFSGFYDTYFNESHFPIKFVNMSEVSSFIFLFPVIILMNIKKIISSKKAEPIQLMLSLFMILLTSWIIFGFPGFIAKISLFSMVTAKRAFLGLGVANIILVIIFLNEHGRSIRGRFTKYEFLNNIDYFLLILALFVLYGIGLDKETGQHFLSNWHILLTSIYMTIAIYFLLNRERLLFGISILILLMPNILVNPISIGLESVYGKEIIKYVERVKENDNSKWVVFGVDRNSSWIANLIKVSGADVLNGVNYTPNIQLGEKLDPTSEQSHIYNRYAHIAFTPNENIRTTSLNLVYSDYYMVSINPCSKILKDFNVNHFVFTYKLDPNPFDCLTSASKKDYNGLWVYARN